MRILPLSLHKPDVLSGPDDAGHHDWIVEDDAHDNADDYDGKENEYYRKDELTPTS